MGDTGGYPTTAPTAYAESPGRRRSHSAEPARGGARTAVAERRPRRVDDGESWKERAAKAATPFKRRKGGAGKRTGRAGGVMGVLLTLALIAGAGYWFWNSQQGRSASGEPYFEKLSVSGLIDGVNEDGFECIPGRTIAQCEKQIPGADLSITLHFDGEAEVTRIEASGGTEAYSDDAASQEHLGEFFAMAAGLPFSGDGGAAEEAGAWASQNVGKSGTEIFGGVQYESAGDQQLLTMRPAEE